jgi:hypothetical protein
MKHSQGYTGQELDALLNSIEGLDWHVYDRKIDPYGGTVIDGEVVIYKENVERALRFAAPNFKINEQNNTGVAHPQRETNQND